MTTPTRSTEIDHGGAGTGSTPSWVADAVFYQIFPDRFADGDPSLDPEGVVPWDSEPTRSSYFGGDLRGIETHLDHLERLGANAIYLTPIFESDRSHRYDTADYYRIDHRLGDLAAFERFLAAAHARGIRVVLDAVFNHCGEGHWAFRHVRAHGAASPYVDWFRIDAFPVVRDPEPNYATCSGCKYLPQFNHANEEVREYLFGVADYWTRLGIDGWRLDVPFFVRFDFWQEFRRRVKAVNPDLYIVAEVWEPAPEWVQGDTADGVMNYPLRDLIVDFAAGRSTSPEFADGVSDLAELLPAASHTAMLNLLGSHDTERILTALGERREALRIAVALQLTSPGPPMVYYGDEIGTVGGDDPGCRSTMRWDEDTWDCDLFEWHRRLIELRKTHPGLRSPHDEVVAVSGRVVVRHRGSGDDAVAVLANGSDQPEAIDRSLLRGATRVLLGPDDVLEPKGSSVILPPGGVAIVGR
jgi:cyclomaltodextrinase